MAQVHTRVVYGSGPYPGVGRVAYTRVLVGWRIPGLVYQVGIPGLVYQVGIPGWYIQSSICRVYTPWYTLPLTLLVGSLPVLSLSSCCYEQCVHRVGVPVLHF